MTYKYTILTFLRVTKMAYYRNQKLPPTFGGTFPSYLFTKKKLQSLFIVSHVYI